jgi:pectinesterase
MVGSRAVGTTGSASVQIRANNFTAVNITFANTTPYGTAQAVALLAQGDEEAFSNDRFLGFQDTLYLKNGRSYFQNCYITGTVDYIFGNGTAVFQNSVISSSAPGTVTAANTNPTTGVGLVFSDSTITSNVVPVSQGGDPGDQSGVPAGSTYLGRPWDYASGSNSSVTYIDTRMGTVVNPAGWTPWDSSEVPGKTDPRYSEFGSMDSNGNALSVSSRVAWSNQLVTSGDANPLLDASNYTLGNIFGPETFWGNQYTDTFAAGGVWDPLAQLTTATAPEASALYLIATAFAGIGLMRRRRSVDML